MPGALEKLITARLKRQAPDGMQAIARKAREKYGSNVLAVIGYGSCLRDGVSPDKIIDLYVLLEDYSAMPESWVLRAGNRILPPNVYYLEAAFEEKILRAKYATITLNAFENWVSPSTGNPYFWARFAQPCVLLYARDENVTARVTAAIREAACTLIAQTLPLMPDDFAPVELWTSALEQTYRTEWRSEGRHRAAEIAAADIGHYASLTPFVLSIIVKSQVTETDGSFAVAKSKLQSATSMRRQWKVRRITGRVFATLRLLKAAFTFQGGIDYLLWKVARHSGVEVKPSNFQRKHPLLGAPLLAWKLYRKGGFR